MTIEEFQQLLSEKVVGLITNFVRPNNIHIIIETLCKEFAPQLTENNSITKRKVISRLNRIIKGYKDER
jgi:imidazoleglycerol phosphate dehydratase HisB